MSTLAFRNLDVSPTDPVSKWPQEGIQTSASRLSTYASGKVTPSAALLLRMRRAADNP
jgi:hypothetical protein